MRCKAAYGRSWYLPVEADIARIMASIGNRIGLVFDKEEDGCLWFNYERGDDDGL